MISTISTRLGRAARGRAPLLLLVLVAVIVESACATDEADLNYTRDQPDPKPGDSSYHGWNSNNN